MKRDNYPTAKALSGLYVLERYERDPTNSVHGLEMAGDVQTKYV